MGLPDRRREPGRRRHGNRLGREPRQDAAGLPAQHAGQGRSTASTRPPSATSSAPGSSAAPTAGTEVYISHRGMQEVYTTERANGQTVWQPRPADPELEAEFLRRLMVRLGVDEERAKGSPPPRRSTSRAPRSGRATARRRAGQRAASTAPGAASAWRSTGSASPSRTATASNGDVFRPLRRSRERDGE